MKNCNCHSDITRDGSGQLQRYLKELDPSYAPIDGRSLEDLLVFAKRYAAQIRFYDIPETPKIVGEDPKKISWKEFFLRDMAVIAASLSNTNVWDFKKEFEEVREKLQTVTTPEVFAALFAPITGMIKKIDRWYTIAIPENPLLADLELAINSNLKQQVQKIIAYDDGFKYVDPKVDLEIDLKGLENENVWGVNETIDPDSSIYKGATTEEKLLYASLFVEDIFHSFYSFLSNLADTSSKYIHFALEKYPSHKPYMALFIAFLEIFRLAQEQLNGVTGRILDFYYKDVLHLESKPSVPDKVHIVFELAKDVSQYNVLGGTELSAGKDNSGIDQLYKTSGDLVVNQAKVKELKTIFIQKEGTGAEQVINTIYARPVANSLDGKGEAFTDEYPKWSTFGEGDPKKEVPDNPCDKLDALEKILTRDDQAKIGFAIASPQLLMQGGKRLISLKLKNMDAFVQRHEELLKTSGEGLFEFWFTGEKKWFSVNTVMTEAQWKHFSLFLPIGVFHPIEKLDGGAYYFDKDKAVIHIHLPVSEQQVTGYDTKLHTDFVFSTTQPVMQVFLNPAFNFKAEDYRALSVDGLSLAVKVGSIAPEAAELRKWLKDNQGKITKEDLQALSLFQPDGLSNITIQTETGLVKPGKTFDPYTLFPANGKTFYLGSTEVFNKPLGELAVFITKTSTGEDNQEQPSALSTGSTVSTGSNSNAEYRVSVLYQRTWKKLISSLGSDFTVPALMRNILHVQRPDESIDPLPLDRKPIETITEWMPGSDKGFLSITNLIPTEKDIQKRQNKAIDSEIKEVFLSYESNLASLDYSIDEFYHLYPFGTIQIYSEGDDKKNSYINLLIKKTTITGKVNFSELDKEKDFLLVKTNKLLPQFTYENFVQQNVTGKTGFITRFNLRELIPGNIRTEPFEAERINIGNMEVIGGYEIRKQTCADFLYNFSRLHNKIEGSNNQYSGLIQEECLLFVGLENAQPLQTVTMLFQFADGSAEDEDNDP